MINVGTGLGHSLTLYRLYHLKCNAKKINQKQVILVARPLRTQ